MQLVKYVHVYVSKQASKRERDVDEDDALFESFTVPEKNFA